MPVNALHGYPHCPNCNRMLTMRSMPGVEETVWYCTGCGEQWDTPTLCQLIDDDYISDLEQDSIDNYRMDSEARKWADIAKEIGGL